MRTLLSSVALVLLMLLPATLFPQKRAPFQVQEYARQSQALKVQADSVALALHFPIRVERPDGTIFELMRIERGIPRYYITDNINAAKTISSNKVWSGAGFGYALSGLGVVLGEWDGGLVRTTHQELTGRVTNADPGGLADHSTHVAGTMIATGVQANAHGMSNQATLISHEWTNDVLEMNNEAAVGLKASNHSYGLITGWTFNYFGDSKWVWFGDSAVSETEDVEFGRYNAEAEAWDGVAEAAPNYLIMKSAGNDRNEGPSGAVLHWFFKNGIQTLSSKARSRDGRLGGYDCINGAGVGKNILTVGAIDDMTGGYVNPAGVIMSSFSSWGPTDDGRIKPDICGNGVSLTSSLSTSNTAYGIFSGTSMASPNVTGSIGLLLQHQQNLHGATPLRSSTMKAIIINTADEAGPNTGPDYVYGWGVMNTLKAAQLMTLDSAEGSGSHIREIVLNQATTSQFDISCDGTQPLRATIAWVDPAHNAMPAVLNSLTSALVNDLDLRIVKKKDLTTYQPWILDPSNVASAAATGDNFRDNVEQIYVASPERAEYTVIVSHKGVTLTGGLQNFSIVISGTVPSIGPIIHATPDSVELSLIPGASKLDSIRIANYGDTTLAYHISYDTTLSWISVAEDSGNVAALDSSYIHYTINAALLPQWTTFTTNVTLTGAASPVVFPFKLHVLGPKIVTVPSYVVVDVDSGASGTDTVKIRNTGFTPLTYVLRDNSGNFPVWMTVNDTDGTIVPGDSALAIMTFNAVSQPVADYTTFMTFASNDSSTGPVVTQVDLHVGTRLPFDVNVHSRWNLVSLPVRPFTHLKTSLYPTATTPAWSFNGSNYVQKDTLSDGVGYWLKFPSAQIVTIDGYTFTADTIALHSGWNIVGAVSEPVAVGSVSTVPGGILASGFFEYNPGFALADSLHPGQGYFVQANAAGSLTMSSGPSALPKRSANSALAGLNSISIEDGARNGQTLYFGEPGLNRSPMMMPPAPPAGSFDARFSSGAMIETVNPVSAERSFDIRVTPVANPVTVRWNILTSEKRRYTIRDEAGADVEMTPNGTMTLSGARTGDRTLTLSYSAPAVPSEYALSQNYPNPFNPSTTISYELPLAGPVTIRVYNILGNEVASVVNGTQEAGYHTAVFDASALPSGVYIYKMQSGRFTAIKKMMLMR